VENIIFYWLYELININTIYLEEINKERRKEKKERKKG
jgi:hypothetical protein